MNQKQGRLEFRTRWFEDIPVGEFHVFGQHTFHETDIIAFGKRYHPHPMHTDSLAAQQHVHQGLVASEWHICAIWMKLMVTYMDTYSAGVNDTRHQGAGIGFQNMQWHKPVRPSDTLTYTNEVIEKPDKVIREKWGIIRARNEAFNQHGVCVQSFNIDTLAMRRPVAS